MIKSLLETEKNQPDEIKPETEKITDAAFEKTAAAPIVEINEPEEPLEILETRFAAADSETQDLADEEMLAELLAEINDERANFPESELNRIENSASRPESESVNFELPQQVSNETANSESNITQQAEIIQPENSDATIFQSSVQPETFAETARKSGLAYAAAITLFGSVVFMLIIGWFADLILGSSPWGIVGGIVVGAAIGFFQFFRLTSQIFKNKE